MRFPWRGGRHPCLDALVVSEDEIVGVESKRYEPYRAKARSGFSAAFDRDVWDGLPEWSALRRELSSGKADFRYVDAVQLVKHALGLAAEAKRRGTSARLVYLFAEPITWPDGRTVSQQSHVAHRAEAELLSQRVRSDAVPLIALDYKALLDRWKMAAHPVAVHAKAVLENFDL